MVVTKEQYSSEIAQIPTFMVMANCPKCNSRDLRYFSDVVFYDRFDPKQPEFNESDQLHIQAQCRSCGGFLTLSPRLYLINSEYEQSDGNTKGTCHFYAMSVGRSLVDEPRSARADEEQEPTPPKPAKVKAKRKTEPKPKAVWYKCRFCEEEFASDDARLRHQKKCDKREQETEKPHKALFLPSSTEVTQDPADVDRTVRYTESDDTLVQLIQEGGMESYRKEFDSCPRTDYVDDGKGGTKSVVCGFTQETDDWLRPPCLKEISFAISDNDVLAPMLTPQEELVVCISECPKCGRKSILHQFLTSMLNMPFTDHRQIMDHIVSRGLMEGKVRKKEVPTKEQVKERVYAEAERMGIPTDMLKEADKDAILAADLEVPEFSIPCVNPDCKCIWTNENSNPVWMTTKYLVARCPVCGSQSPIQDQLKKSARAGTARGKKAGKSKRGQRPKEDVVTKRSDYSPCKFCGNRAGEECLVSLAPDALLAERGGLSVACEGYGPDSDIEGNEKCIREIVVAMSGQDNPKTGSRFTVREIVDDLAGRGLTVTKSKAALWIRQEGEGD